MNDVMSRFREAGKNGLDWAQAVDLVHPVLCDETEAYGAAIDAHDDGQRARVRAAVQEAIAAMATPCDPFIPWRKGEVAEANWLRAGASVADGELTVHDASTLIEVAAQAAPIQPEEIIEIVSEFCPVPKDALRLAETALHDFQYMPARHAGGGAWHEPGKAPRARRTAEELAEIVASVKEAFQGIGRAASEPKAEADRLNEEAQERQEYDAQIALIRERAKSTGIEPANLPAHLAVPPFRPSPFHWVDPAAIPRRDWLYGTHLIRREISLTLAPGGVGKTSLLVAEALAMTTGQPLLHEASAKPLRVWLWNGEEPGDELTRRIMAAALHYGLSPEQIEGRLFVDTGHEVPLVIAEDTAAGTRVLRPVIDRLVRVLREREIDVMIVDPFISTHRVGENDTVAMQQAATAWKTVAYEAGVAIDLSHHMRKIGHQEATVDDGRGSSALKDKARHARALSPMSAEEARSMGLRPEERFSYFATGAGDKSNMAARASRKAWYHLQSVGLGNGALNAPQDCIAVVTPWAPAEAPQELDLAAVARLANIMSDQEWRADWRARSHPFWIGRAVSEAFELGAEGGWEGNARPIIAMLEARRIIVRGYGQTENRKPTPVFRLGERETAET